MPARTRRVTGRCGRPRRPPSQTRGCGPATRARGAGEQSRRSNEHAPACAHSSATHGGQMWTHSGADGPTEHSTREPARPRRAAARTGRGGVTWSDRQGPCGSRHSTQSRTQRKGPEEKAARLEESPLRGAGSARAGRRRGRCRGQEPEAGGTGATRGLGARPRESP